jgi:2,4-dienoyl-CoA reductase-like NADH-dependent reductase (Old Yellow Enzyme family)
MQISHAGRQTPFTINKSSVAPSAKQLEKLLGVLKFGKPKELTHTEILDIIERFIHAAEIAKQTGFTGVQLHSAHGYLLSEFLSPDINQRTDEWGGSIQNRSRLLITIIEGIRAKVGSDFPISIKLNSSDFQKGGFTHEESIEVSKLLNETSLDLLEISGGTYEQFAALDLQSLSPDKSRTITPSRSTVAREAYFLKYADEIKKNINMPLAVTGGFRTTQGMNEALNSNACDVIGLGRPLCSEPNIVNELLTESKSSATLYENMLQFGPGVFGLNSSINFIKANNKASYVYWCYRQILRLADKKEVKPNMNLLGAAMSHMMGDAKASKIYRNYWKDLD